jgi:alpha-tubulin suppressor-like RCC1 family protein
MEIELYVHFFQVSGGWRHSMALTSTGQLFGWGWNKVGTWRFLLFSLKNETLMNTIHRIEVYGFLNNALETILVCVR